MADTFFKTDFFAENKHEKKGRSGKERSRISSRRFLPYLRIPIEYTVISAVVVLVLLVVFFALGVEHGKKMVRIEMRGAIVNEPEFDKAEGASYPEIVEIAPEVEEIREEITVNTITEEVAEIPKEKVDSKKPVEKPVDGKEYAIYLIAFNQLPNAESEIKKLKDVGMDATYITAGSWYQVLVSGIETIEEAKEKQRELSGRYPDCYIRRKK
jgi:SPOR domain